MSMTVDRVVDATSGITRSQLLRYYESLAGLMMPHLRARPVAFLRAPEGIEGGTFFQKHLSNLRLPGVAQFNSTLYANHGPLLEVRETLGVLSAARADVIEFHTFNTTVHPGEHANRVAFDLDPGDGVDWPSVCEAALRLRDVLQLLGLVCWLKTSGGKGLHVLVPLAPGLHSCEAARHFSEALVRRLAQEESWKSIR
jgi:bifunctional non-homologous end joining protein LigD